MLKPAAVTFALSTASWAFAQTATLAWQVDDGRGWTSNQITTTQPSVQVRLLAEWTPDAGYAFGVTRFDGRITTSHAAQDLASQFGWAFPLLNDMDPRPIGRRFGSVLKIDRPNDTQPPGLGAEWATCGQSPEIFEPVVTNNPIDLLHFTLTFDDTPGIRAIDQIFTNPINGRGNTVDRVMAIYLAPSGGGTYPLTTISNLQINYVPAWPTASLFGVALAFRRRRR